MSSMYRENQELFDLLEAVCEDRISAGDSARLEEILSHDRDARRLYRAYLNLHGQLYWDTAIGADSTELPVYRPASKAASASQEGVPPASHRRKNVLRWAAGAVSAAAVALAAVWFLNRPDSNGDGMHLADANGEETQSAAGSNRRTTPRPRPELPLINVNRNVNADSNGPGPVTSKVAQENGDPTPAPITHGSSDETILAFINGELQSGWKAAEVEPSPPAEEAEWVRRVYLDLVGRIPTPDEATAYFVDLSRGKRERLVDRLLDRPEFVYNWTTIWSNLMVGRSPDRDEYRTGLQKFLRDSFRENRPWDQTVAALISAEGTPEQNGASGFLLAHVNNQAVPATAVTAKVFLGVQVQCTQCHDHPFNDAEQNEFWELNSFFKQIDRVVDRKYDPATGRMLQEVALRKKPNAGGPTFYEKRSGVVHPAYPVYNGVRIDEGPEVDRRKELAVLLAAGDKPQIAQAFVNRLWQHFFGYGFTNPVDDMGSHNAPTHSQLLDRLAREFVYAGYDQKRLMKWICLCDAYALSSRQTAGNESDSPEVGDPPLFSRVYVKEMTAEQAYDSLLVATGALSAQSGDWERIERQRRQWLQQFVYSYDTDENDEHTAFSGTVSQALKMMNGELISEALRYDRSTVFRSILNADVSESEKIRRLCLAALTRYPTDQELAAVRKLIARNAQGRNRREAIAEGLQDVFWAYLNSSEFVLVH